MELTKEQVHQRVLKDGKPLDLNLFNWDIKSRTFKSDVSGLVLDFTDIDNVKFKTGYACSFTTGFGCTFDTGNNCTFSTESDCTFKTGCDCVFNVFNTGSECIFVTGSDCLIRNKSNNEVITPPVGIKLTTCPLFIPGYLVGNDYYVNGVKQDGEYMIADGILSKIRSKKGNVFKVNDYNTDNHSFNNK